MSRNKNRRRKFKKRRLRMYPPQASAAEKLMDYLDGRSQKKIFKDQWLRDIGEECE